MREDEVMREGEVIREGEVMRVAKDLLAENLLGIKLPALCGQLFRGLFWYSYNEHASVDRQRLV